MSVTHPAVALLERERSHVDAALRRVYSDRLALVGEGLAEPVRYALDAGGKRLRPAVCIAAYRAASAQTPGNAVYDAAAAIELIHTYSLLHDDLPCMDDDDFRRGRPTAHRVYGATRATLAGAMMIPIAATLLGDAATRLGLDVVRRADTVRELTLGAGAAGMVGGQVMDLAAEGCATSIVELEAIHSRKTGALFTAALGIGARLAHASAETVAAFRRCGGHLGLAFQVTDDVLDEVGEVEVLGKTAGRDREQGKATYPGLVGIDGARVHAEAAAKCAIEALRNVGVMDREMETLIGFAVSRDR